MNAFGRLFRVTIFGESHGESVGVNIDGCPAGLSLTAEDFVTDIERRKGGMQKGTTPRKEDDLPHLQNRHYSTTILRAPRSLFSSITRTRAAAIMKSSAPCPVRAMPIL